MNESPLEESAAAATECCSEVDECVRRNPGTAILVAIGTGLVIGMLVRALRPAPTPRDRVTRMLEDLEDRLRDVSGPILRKTRALASDGLDAAHEGRSRAEGLLASAARQVKSCFS